MEWERYSDNVSLAVATPGYPEIAGDFCVSEKYSPPSLEDITPYTAAKSKGLITDPFLQKARNPIQIVNMLTASATSKQSKNPITNTQGRAKRKPTRLQQERVLIY